ncbi:hypothetical protein [Algibacter mikhailovii]|nr:hypothetical protein [Algibacter mikhailovii]
MKTIKNLKTKIVSLSMMMVLSIGNISNVFANNMDPVLTTSNIKEPVKLNASNLIQSASKALTYTIKASKESKDSRIKADNKDAAPYWQALKNLNSQLDKAERGAMLKDESFFLAMAAAITTSEELKIAYQMTNVSDNKIQEGITKTSDAIQLLYVNFSKEGQDKDANKPLNKQEREQLEKLKEKQKELQVKLNDMEKKMGKNSKGVKELREKSKELENAKNNRHDYFWAMHSFHMMHGWMMGWHWYWGPMGGWCSGFSVVIFDSYYDYYAWDSGYDWGYLDAVVDIEYELEVELDDLEVELYDDYINDYELIEQDYMDTYDMPESLNDTYDNGGLDVQSMDLEQDNYEQYDLDMPELDYNDLDW